MDALGSNALGVLPLGGGAPNTVEAGLGLASETDTAFAITAVRIIALGLASETDTAFALTAARAYAVGLASETDSALEIRPVRIIPLGLAQEVDLAFDITPVKTAIDAGIPLQRYLVRTAKFDQLGECAIEDFRISIKRGIGDNSSEPFIRFRVDRDNKGFGKWVRKGLGKAGERFSTVEIGALGTAHVWQFEVTCDDDCDIELQGIEAIFKKIGH